MLTTKEKVPPVHVPGGYEEAVRFLQRPQFLGSTQYRAQQWSAERRGASDDLLEFEKRMVKMLAAIDIPAYAKTIVVSPKQQAGLYVAGKSNDMPGTSPHNHGKAAAIYHSIREDIPPLAWEVFEHVGKEAARSLGLTVRWGGPAEPWFWELTD